MKKNEKVFLSPPVNFGVANPQSDFESWEALAKGQGKGPLYARNNSNDAALSIEQSVQALEGTDHATSFSSGMAAISNVLFALLAPGKSLVVGKDTYGGSSHLFTHVLPKWGVNVTMLDTLDEASFEKRLNLGCDVLYLETPTNPMLKIQNIKKMASLAHAAGAVVVIDNTVATPLNQTPAKLGADVVIHSATKFLSGHADALGGIACFSHHFRETIMAHKEIHGACMGPMTAYLIARGLKTLDVRMERHNSNAMALANWLSDQAEVEGVNYPGLTTHPSYDLARHQMDGFGALLSFTLKGGDRAVANVMNNLQKVVMASTLGSVETMVGTPSTTSHVECTIEERRALGIPDGLIRCSVGLEKIEEIQADFDQAFSKI